MLHLPAPYALNGDTFEVAVNRFIRHFPYKVLESQFPSHRHRAFLECWHCLPEVSVRFCCDVSGLARGTADRLVKRLTGNRLNPHIRGAFAFGCDITEGLFPRRLAPH